MIGSKEIIYLIFISFGLIYLIKIIHFDVILLKVLNLVIKNLIRVILAFLKFFV